MADPGGSAIALVGKYLASKGLPYTAENVRRALQLNASNPGTIPQLVNGDAGTSSDPASDNGPGAKTKPQPVKSQQQSQRMPVPQPPQSTKQPSALTSDSASGPLGAQAAPSSPQQPPQGGNMLTNLIEAILGGGAGALPGLLGGKPSVGSGVPGGASSSGGVGGAASSMHAPASGWPPGTSSWSTGGVSSAEPIGNTPMPPTGRMIDVPGAAIGGPQPQQLLSGPQAAQPQPPLQIGQQLKLGGPAPQAGMPQPQPQLPPPTPQAQPEVPMNLLGDMHGQPAQMQQLPQGPPTQAPQMFDAAHLPEAKPGINMLDWSKILGEVKPLLGHLKP